MMEFLMMDISCLQKTLMELVSLMMKMMMMMMMVFLIMKILMMTMTDSLMIKTMMTIMMEFLMKWKLTLMVMENQICSIMTMMVMVFLKMMMTLTMMEFLMKRMLMMIMMEFLMVKMMMMIMTVLMMMRMTMTTMTELKTMWMMTMRGVILILTVTISQILKTQMMMVTPELALTPLDLATEQPGDPSSSSLHLSCCSSVTENLRRFSTRKDKLRKRKRKRVERPKSQHFLRNQSPCRHSIMNQTNSLDSHGLTPMYLTNHTSDALYHSRTN